MKNRQWHWLWPLLLMLCIFTVSGATRVATPDIGLAISKDKIGHFLVFGLLATAILRIPRLQTLGPTGFWLAVATTVAFGGFDEWRQSFTPGREVEFADWLADSLGALVACFVYRYWPAYRKLLEYPLFSRRQNAGSS